MFSETVSLYFKSGLFNMEIWESGIASGGFDIKITWFEKKNVFLSQGLILGSWLPWSPDCPWTQVD